MKIIYLIHNYIEIILFRRPHAARSNLTTLLKGIRDNIQQIVEIAVDIALNFIKGITKKLPAIIQAGVDLIFAFIDGISDAIANNGDRARKALVKLGKSMLKGIKDFFTLLQRSLSRLVNNL